MGDIRLDSYVEYIGGGSTVEYIEKRLASGDFLKFWDAETFFDLKRANLIVDGAIVRTSDGTYDRSYVVSSESELLGMHFDAYPLEKRVYSLDEIFVKENIVDGYVVESKVFPRLFREWVKVNK